MRKTCLYFPLKLLQGQVEKFGGNVLFAVMSGKHMYVTETEEWVVQNVQKNDASNLYAKKI